MNQSSDKTDHEQKIPISANEQKTEKSEQTERRLTPFEEAEHMFDSLFKERWIRPFNIAHPFWHEMPTPFLSRLSPRVDIINRDDKVILRAQIPGVAKQDIDLSMSDNTVTITGHTSHEHKEERDDYYRRECSSGSFSRTISLPDNIDGSKAKATFNNGMLELTIPKNETSKRHSVPIE